MFRGLSAELLKIKRSKMLTLALLASVLPATIRGMQTAFGKNQKPGGWEGFLASGQEIAVLGILVTVVLVSSFVISMEYQYNTASYIFTSRTTRGNIYCSKVILIFSIIAVLFAVSAATNLAVGFLAVGKGVPAVLFRELIKVSLWYWFSYSLLSILVVMLAILSKRFVLPVIVTMGYTIMVFPFHLKNNLFICPFMTPAAVAAKIYHSENYMFKEYYSHAAVSFMAAAFFLTFLAAVSLALGLVRYKKSDAVQ